MADIRKLPNKEEDDFGASLAKAQRTIDQFSQLAEVLAQRRKIAYDAYIRAGFTKAESLELCKHI